MADGRALHLEAVEFSQPCPSIYRCRQCSDVSTALLRARCGHGFCSRCVNYTIGKTGKFRCPVDSSLVEKTELSVDLEVKEKVLQLEAFCLQRKRGCKRTVLLRNLEKHLETCGFVPVTCPCNCGLQVCKRDLAGHLAAECDHRLVICDFCTEEMAFMDKQAHHAVCNKKPVCCPHCKTKFLRQELASHEEGCLKKPHRCQLAEAGCQFKGSRKEVEDHEKDVGFHLGIVATAIVACQKSVQELQEKVSVLSSKNEKLNEQVQKILPSLESVKSLELRISQIEEKLKDQKVPERNHKDMNHTLSLPSKIIIQRKPSTSEDSVKSLSPPSSSKSPSLRGLFNHVNSDERPKVTAPPTAL